MAVATADAACASSGALLAHELVPAARLVEEAAERFDLRLLWHPTVQFDPAIPLGEQVCRGPRCGGDTAIRVEPDGSVIPARGPFCSAGNLIRDTWETIEQSEIYASYRRRVESDTHCDRCPGLAICAADCPREPAGWAMTKSG
jgi:radical SAM protein with 4Fe4S-binding SPASM domain